jgi:hypothetical protein
MTHLRFPAGLVCAAMLATTPLSSQVTAEQRKASYAAHKSDFDYLLGDWEFTSESRDYGKFGGRWSAVRLDTGQILDEYRVLGDKGETFYVSSTIRAFNAAVGQWELIGMDAGGGLQDFGTARLINSDMHIEQRFGVAAGKPIKLRIRYYNIHPDRFSWSADRSTDGGQTWTKDFQTIEAHRIGPSRILGPLAPLKEPQRSTNEHE